MLEVIKEIILYGMAIIGGAIISAMIEIPKNFYPLGVLFLILFAGYCIRFGYKSNNGGEKNE